MFSLQTIFLIMFVIEYVYVYLFFICFSKLKNFYVLRYDKIIILEIWYKCVKVPLISRLIYAFNTKVISTTRITKKILPK